MSDISGLSGTAGFDAEQNAAQVLLSVNPPPLVPADTTFGDAVENDSNLKPVENRPERGFPKASWLDAMPPEAFEEAGSEPDHISSVNSDDNGLYRMFISISP